MLSSKTVFIVGAGASSEAGLPVGSELKGIIARKLDLRFEHFSSPIGSGDLTIFEALRRQYPNDINTYLGACWRVRDGIILAPSIDDFIDAHQEDETIAECGKLAIARSILEAERRSKLFYELRNIEDTVNFSSIKDTWYFGFFQLLNHRMTRGDLEGFF